MYGGTYKESKRPWTHSSYVVLFTEIIDADPSSDEEVAKKKWKKTMIKEY